MAHKERPARRETLVCIVMACISSNTNTVIRKCCILLMLQRRNLVFERMPTNKLNPAFEITPILRASVGGPAERCSSPSGLSF